MKYIPFLLFAIALVLPACKNKTTKSAMKHGEKLKSAINDFEKNRQKLSVKLVSSLEDAEQKLTAEDPDLPKVSSDFEKQWTSIQKRYKGFKNDFERVGKTSEDYFAKLDELVNNINKESLRNQELAKNDALRQKWESSYQEAKVSIDKVTQVLEAGNDFHMVLVASSIRQKLEQNVSELNLIAAQAKELLSDLEAFTLAGRELVEG
jgi:uncharacterized protein YnzC (UPF0291/DUF896 family)